MLTKFEMESQGRQLALLERIARSLERLGSRETTPGCQYCSPCITDPTERENFNYCPMCGRKLAREE